MRREVGSADCREASPSTGFARETHSLANTTSSGRACLFYALDVMHLIPKLALTLSEIEDV